MPTFDNVSFPTDATHANGAIVGGPIHKASIVSTSDGTEQRNGISGLHARRFFHLSTGPVNEATRVAVLNFFDARRGQSDSFRFRDPFDHTAALEPIVGGQLVKRYTVGSVNYDRPITRPINGTVTFSGGGTLNYDTGVISGGAGGTWSGQFEIEARFASDLYVESNWYTDHHEVEVDIIEAVDTDYPAITPQTAPTPTITYALTLPFEVGRNRLQAYSTGVDRGGGYSEERTPRYGGGFPGFRGTVMCANRTQLETLLSLFLCVRGPRSAFQYESFNVRFKESALTIRYTGNESFEADVELVAL